ncbi:hypothetical protein VP1G_02459 [Cytospora mali]|uniref:RING-type domain-containing protein n=1 Tax=Cytospora mali TaxID=578113 RepID=A0A194UU60_CYTMA|nr:hypothetical protein VP1G_02459 [Valsa mali var. pyri (nom. inval.)]
MVFSALLHSSPMRPRASRTMSVSSSKSDKSQAEYIHDESQLPPAAGPDTPDLRDLNNSLEALAIVFPDIQVEVFREMLSSFDEESRLAVVADALLKNRVGWVKGRWRRPQVGNASPVPPSETFRSPEYIAAAKSLAWHEFKGLSRSTINAVLAETNYSYLDARRTLVDLSQKSWRYTLSSLLLYRRKPVTAAESENHPLITWKSSGQGSIVPSLKSTGNAELDRELFKELILPLKTAAREKIEETDRELAAAMNLEEAEAQNQIHECCCCFTTGPFEEFTACNSNGHMICVRCVQLSITQAMFGQGWAKSIEPQTGTLRCPAMPEDHNADCCEGCIPFEQMHKAMLEMKKGAEIMLKLEQRLAEHSLVASGLPVVRCPFCDYAEVDDVYLTRKEMQLRLKTENLYNIVLIGLGIVCTPFLLILTLISLFIALLFSSEQTFGDKVLAELKASLARHHRRQRGLRFTCQSPSCGRTSCLSCSKEWIDIHVCHESSLVALRTQVEQAMSMAVKRVCPKCNASFVKTAGCNKMTCQCGYKMCYVCRKDIGGTEGQDAGYQHFCQHFRPQGDGRPCTACNKCNLWQKEDTEAVLQKAKEEAERKWKEVENRELSGAEMAFLETGVAVKNRGVEAALTNGRIPTIAEVCEMVVGNIFA